MMLFHQPIERAARQLGFERRGPHVAVVPREQIAQILRLEPRHVLSRS